jgi:hypothetical protein
MRKILYVILGLICCTVTFIACFDEKDFKFDKFTISDLDPTLYIPLVNDTIRLDASNDYNVLYDEEGVGYLHFAIEDNILPPVKDFFEVPPSANFSISYDYPYAAIGGFSITIPGSYQYGFSRPDTRIDSIIFKAGTLSLSINTPPSANGAYTVPIPALKKNNVAFSERVPFGTSSSFNRDLSGYILAFTNNNAFEIIIDVEILSSDPAGSYKFNSISFSNVEVSGVYGYFGQHSAFPSPVSINVSTFDKFRNNNTTTLHIKEAFLNFCVDNGAGFPIQLRIDEVASISGGLREEKDKIDSVIIPSNKLQESFLRTEHHIGGKAFGEILSNMPSEMEFNFSATINPEGSKSGTVKNFLTDASSITVSNIETRVPLNFSVSGMVLKDTLNFSASRVTFNDMELLMNVENRMPVEVLLQAYLMDEEGNLLNTPSLFEVPVSIPAATVDVATGKVTAPYLHKTVVNANVKALEQAKKLKVEIIVNSGPAAGYVCVTKDNYVYIKMGAKARVNIDNLD